jgi:hypothetical protein
MTLEDILCRRSFDAGRNPRPWPQHRMYLPLLSLCAIAQTVEAVTEALYTYLLFRALDPLFLLATRDITRAEGRASAPSPAIYVRDILYGQLKRLVGWQHPDRLAYFVWVALQCEMEYPKRPRVLQLTPYEWRTCTDTHKTTGFSALVSASGSLLTRGAGFGPLLLMPHNVDIVDQFRKDLTELGESFPQFAPVHDTDDDLEPEPATIVASCSRPIRTLD